MSMQTDAAFNGRKVGGTKSGKSFEFKGMRLNEFRVVNGRYFFSTQKFIAVRSIGGQKFSMLFISNRVGHKTKSYQFNGKP